MFAASTVAGAVNSIAGGGSLITFPMLIWLGEEPILANATNTVSLSPGSIAALHGFRRELQGLRDWIVWGTLPSLAGGVLGAVLRARATGEGAHLDVAQADAAVAWQAGRLDPLLFAFSGPLNALVSRHRMTSPAPDGLPRAPRWVPVMFYQLLVSVYGGYFGAGIGIMMLAGLGLAGFTAIHRMIALRNYYAILINGVAAVYFIAVGAVHWPDAVVLTVGQVVGGLIGARSARNLPAATVRWIVVGIGVAIAVLLLVS